MEYEKFENYSEEVKGQVRKYFDDNNIEICFTLESWALKDDFEKVISVEDSAKSFIEELLED